MTREVGKEAIARLRLFGTFTLTTGDGTHVPIRNKRARALLAFLFLTPGHKASREQLAGHLWTDSGDEQARASLRQCLRGLRAELSTSGLALIDASIESVWLNPNRVESDVDLLTDSGAHLPAQSMAKALGEAGRTRLLEDLDLRGLIVDWIGHERRRLERQIADTVRNQLARFESLAEWQSVRLIAEAYLQRDPLDETVVVSAIKADIAMGDTSAAHRRYQLLHEQMKRELGVSPAPTTLRILNGAHDEKPRPPETQFAPGLGTADKPSDAHISLPPLVVVTQFTWASQDGDGSRIATTIREELVSGLSRFSDLRVITDPLPLDELDGHNFDRIAGAYALGAGIRIGTGGARLTVRLVRLDDDRTIWSEQFAAPDIEMVDTIDNIIAKTVGGVLPKINSDLLKRPSNLPVDSVYRRYLVAREAARTASSFSRAQGAARLLETLIESHPDFSLPFLPLAFLYNTDFNCTRAGSSGSVEFSRALELAKQAIVLDRDNAHAYSVTGWCLLRRRSWAPAQRNLELALELNPFHATRVMEVGWGLMFLGDLDRAEALLHRCLLLNPTPIDDYFQDLGMLALLRGEHDKAAGYFELIAAPSVWDKLYAAVNAELGAFASAEQAHHATLAVSEIWPADRPMQTDEVLKWVDLHHPFQKPEMSHRLLRGVGHVLNRGAP